MTKNISVHKDILNREIQVGNKVATAMSNSLIICNVTKLLDKMIRVVDIKHPSSKGYTVYSCRCVVIEGEDVLAYLLKV